MSRGKFVLKKITDFADIEASCNKYELPESDLCFQTDTKIFQFQYIKSDTDNKYEIKPGFQTLILTSHGLSTASIEFRKRELLESISSTSAILKEAQTFFSKLHIYDQLGRQKKRGVLLYSAPGCGKSSSIERFCQEFAAEDPGTVVLVWPTSKIEADTVLEFLSAGSVYSKECTRLILVIEDIGGSEHDSSSTRYVDSGLLNLLDGIGLTFKLPTFVVATTNHPESLLASLADRPGRFDLMLKISPPTYEEKIKLLSFFAKRELTDEEKKSLGKKGAEDFSVAHLEEIVVRSMLHDKSFEEVIDELINHSKLFHGDFQERQSVGFGR